MKKNRVILLYSIMIVMFFFAFKEVYNLSIALGNNDGIYNMIKTVRYPLERQEISFSRWFFYIMYISQCISYVAFYVYAFNLLKNKNNITYLCLSMLFIPFTILTTGRLDMLCYLLYCTTTLSILLLRKYNFSLVIKFKILYMCFACIAVFILLFFTYGNLTGKVISVNRTPLTILAHYGGLSYPALDLFLQNTRLEDNLIGGNTLLGVYSNLRFFDIELPKVNVFLEFVQFDGIDTNVYSCFRRYIADYGIIGMGCILTTFGMLYSFAYDYVKYHINIFSTILYSSFVWCVIMSFHDEKFLMSIINTATVYKSLLIFIIIKYCIKLQE